MELTTTKMNSLRNDFQISEKVLSDHAEIQFATGLWKNPDNFSKTFAISSWNINNNICSTSFGLGETFSKSHLFVKREEGVSDEEFIRKNDFFQKKDDIQIKEICKQFIEEKTDIFILIESNEVFQKKLREKLPDTVFMIDEITFNNNHNRNKFSNRITFLVETKRCTILKSGLYTKQYTDEANQIKELLVPYVKICKSIDRNARSTVYGVYIDGNKKQFPKSGVNTLFDYLESERKWIGEEQMIIAGDFNTCTKNLIQFLNDFPKFTLWDAPYLTHATPNLKSANYDHVFSYNTGINFTKKEDLPESSRKLIEALDFYTI